MSVGTIPRPECSRPSGPSGAHGPPSAGSRGLPGCHGVHQRRFFQGLRLSRWSALVKAHRGNRRDRIGQHATGDRPSGQPVGTSRARPRLDSCLPGSFRHVGQAFQPAWFLVETRWQAGKPAPHSPARIEVLPAFTGSWQHRENESRMRPFILVNLCRPQATRPAGSLWVSYHPTFRWKARRLGLHASQLSPQLSLAELNCGCRLREAQTISLLVTCDCLLESPQFP